jgi:Zn-dependent protease with chaperone function
VQRVVKPLAVVLAVPILFAALAVASRNESDARRQAGLRRQFLVRGQRPDERLIARYSLASLCGDPRTASQLRPCRSYKLFSSMATASVGTGALGIAFLGAVAGAAAACRSSRRRLLRLFRPALYATVTGLVLLVLLHGALGVAGLFLLGEVVQRWPFTLVLALAAATIAAALSMVHVALAVTRTPSPSVVGRMLDPAVHRRLLRWLGDTAAAVGVEVPDHVVAGLRPGVFVTEAPVVCLDGRVTGRTFYLSLPLARLLSVEELRALVAHELAHFDAAQLGASSRFVPLHAGARQAIERLSRPAAGLGALTSLPALSILSFFMEAFEAGAARVGRDRELAADRAAAAVAGGVTLASALTKWYAFGAAWEAVSLAMDRAVLEDSQYVNASELFARLAAANSGPERLLGVGAVSWPHPTDVHPPLVERVRALAVTPGEAAAAALETGPAHAAIALVEDYEAIERDLSEVEHRIAAMALGRMEPDGTTPGRRSAL